MMTLTTVSKKTSNSSALVFWRVGTKRKGVLNVHIDFDHEEADLLTELVAIRYLALGKSSKKFASKFAACLTGRLKGATIEVSQSMEFMDEPGEGNVELFDADKQAHPNP